LEEVVLHALERDPRERFDSAFAFREVLVHPESVVITNRAARLRPKARLPQWLRALLTIVGGLIAYGLLFFAITRLASLTHR
jgi:hypothetical protein